MARKTDTVAAGGPGREAQGASPAAPAGPVRMCCVCRRRFPKRQLARYTRDESGELIFDAKMTGPGRGWYVCADERCRRKFAGYRPSRRRRG